MAVEQAPTQLNVVDSSAWLAWFADEPTANDFDAPIQAAEHLLVPSICIYEVGKVLLREAGRPQAIEAVAHMRRGSIVVLSDSLALNAAQTALDHQLAMADAIILTTAQAHRATLWTQDEDFAELPNVRYFAKQK